MNRYFYIQIPEESVQFFKVKDDSLEKRIYDAITYSEALRRPISFSIADNRGLAVVHPGLPKTEVSSMSQDQVPGNEPPREGWWPEEAFAPVTQMLFRHGRAVGNVVKNSAGWRSYSLIELNNSGTGGLPLTTGSVKDRATAKKQVEDYADKLGPQ